MRRRHVLRWIGALAGLIVTGSAFAFDPPPVRVEHLPPEALVTLRLIDTGGPFPHKRDGIVFQNRERLLPPRPRGTYREYTVKMPGAGNRGARRIITAGDPPRQYYYTPDHYQSFQRILR